MGIQQNWRIPWCCLGDFNIVRFPSERRGETCLTLAKEKFSEFIEDLNLVDFPLEGGAILDQVVLINQRCLGLIELWSLQIRMTIS